MIHDNLAFLSKNVREIQASEKRLKIFAYFRKLNTPTGFVILHETHSSSDVKKKWNDGFQGQFFCCC